MKQIVLNIPDSKYNFFMELVHNFSFIKIENKPQIKQLSKEQQDFVDGLKQSLKEVELHQQGKIKLKTADQLLDEL